MTLVLIAKVTVLLACVGLGIWALRKSSAAARHMVGTVGLVAAMVLPVVAVVVPTWDVQVPAIAPAESAPTLPAVAPPAAEPAPEPRSQPAPVPKSEPKPEPVPAELLAVHLSDPADTHHSDPARYAKFEQPVMEVDSAGLLASATGTPWIGKARDAVRSVPAGAWGAIWFAGLAFVLGRLLLGWMRMTQIAIDARPLDSESTWSLVEECREALDLKTTPSILVTPKLRVPVLWGFVKPALLLPTEAFQWPTERLRIVLLHELSHMKRRDGLSLLTGRVAAALWWFHPMVWVIERRVRRDCETACDDMVLATGERPSNYAAHLLAIAGNLPKLKPEPVGALSVLGRGELERRIQSILNGGERRGLGRLPAMAMMTACSFALLGIAGAQFTSEAAISTATQEEHAMSSVQFMPAESPMTADSPKNVEDKIRDKEHVQFADRKHHKLEEQHVMAAHNDHDHGSAEYREGARAFKRAHKAHDEEDWNESIRLWKESAELGYKVGTSYYNAACGYARMGDARSAVDWLEKSLDEDFDMRSLLRSDGDLDPIRRDPVFKDFLASLEDRGIMRGGDRRLEKAQDAYEYLQETNSDDAKRWYKVGSNLLGMREYDAAVDALERAAELSPDKNANANYNLACAYALSGDESAALRYLETAVLNGFDSEERFRNDSDLDSIRGTARFEELNELREVLSLDRFHSGWGDWGSNYSKRRWAPAIEEYQEFVRESPNIGRAWSNLGWALHHSYRHAEAREAFERQLDLGYKPGIATYNIGCTYAMEGNDDQAMEWVQRSVDMGSTNAHQILSDEDLKTLRDHPGFRDLLESAGGFEHWEDTEGWSLDRMIDRIGSGIRHHLHNFNHDDDHDPADHLDRKDRAERPEDVVY